jgi:8-oxo-dGTP pyrophosphatase MutT (NUDIX family)
MDDIVSMYEDRRQFASQCEALVPVETVHENPWFVIKNRGGYYTIEYASPQVIVLPVVDSNWIVTVRVKRPVLQDSPYELPAGGSLEGESLDQTASRELKEETGIEINDLSRFIKKLNLFNSPNRDPQPLDVFQISLTREEYDRRLPHDHEVAAVSLFSFDELVEMIVMGDLYISASIAVIARYLFSRKKEKGSIHG